MHHRILPALLALTLMACGAEGSNTELTESTGVQADAVRTACSTPLSNGVRVTGISAELDAWSCTYTLEVPEGTGRLSFDMNQASDGRGAAYMHVRFGAEPTFDTYDCRPGNLVGVNCTFLRPRAGTWYVKISAVFSNASGLELTGTYTLGIPSDSVLTNGVETAPYSYKRSQWKCFTLDVPSGKSSVVFTERLTKGSGWNEPPSLYVRHGEQPSKTANDCATYPDYGLGTCTINNPAAGTWFACSYSDYPLEGVAMKGTYL